MKINTPQAKRLFQERAKVLARVTTTKAEYEAKWIEVNNLTAALYVANGGDQ